MSDSDPLRLASRPVVLVVDDVADNRRLYAGVLRAAGFRVAEATSGEEALALAETSAPDAIVMDLSLPGIGGWEAIRRLRARRSTRDVPVVAITGHALAGAEREAREAGCDAFLIKPCSPEQLVAEVRRVIALPGEPVARAPAPGPRPS